MMPHTDREEMLQHLKTLRELSKHPNIHISGQANKLYNTYRAIEAEPTYPARVPRSQAVEKLYELMIKNYPAAVKTAQHFGYIELREFLDFMYDGPPKSVLEELRCEDGTD